MDRAMNTQLYPRKTIELNCLTVPLPQTALMEESLEFLVEFDLTNYAQYIDIQGKMLHVDGLRWRLLN